MLAMCSDSDVHHRSEESPAPSWLVVIEPLLDIVRYDYPYLTMVGGCNPYDIDISEPLFLVLIPIMKHYTSIVSHYQTILFGLYDHFCWILSPIVYHI